MQLTNLNDNAIFEDSQVFRDVARSGKQRPWQKKKKDNMIYSEYLKILEFKKYSNVVECAETLKFKRTLTGHLKLYQTWFCKSKLCPMCAWRRSMMYSNQLKQIVEVAQKKVSNGRWVFMTLSEKNVTNGKDLSDSIKKMNLSFTNMMRYKSIKRFVLGTIRTTEVTVNEQDNTYNQHIHILMFVKPSYFSHYYLKQEDWQGYWKKAMKLDYEPLTFVQAVRPKKGQTDITSAVLETAKYTVKSTDYLNKTFQSNKKVIADLEEGLYKKRDISFSGILKEIRKELHLKDVEKADLIKTDEEEQDHEELESGEIIVKWNQSKKDYFYYEG